MPGRSLLMKASGAAFLVLEPPFSTVSLLLHGDGATGSTTIVDSSSMPKTVTAFGNAQISALQSKYGNGSIAFDGAGDYCTIATSSSFQFGANDATVEAWVYPTVLTGVQVIIDARPEESGTFSTGIALYLNGATLSVAKSRIAVLQASGTLMVNSWHHVAWSRQGSSNRLFLNGNLVSIVTDNTSYPLTGIYVGSNSILPSPAQFFNGYIDDIRITKGAARYTANFTPPTAAFPDF